MLETEAKTKLCPFKLAWNAMVGRQCEGGACMAWEVWTRPGERPKREDGTVDYTKPLPRIPFDPPQGHCGMVPPELNCAGS